MAMERECNGDVSDLAMLKRSLIIGRIKRRNTGGDHRSFI